VGKKSLRLCQTTRIGGAFANEGAEYLDGQPLKYRPTSTCHFCVPTQDSISEFKVQDNNLWPEWGKFAGGVINMSTKSGTNTWHGGSTNICGIRL